MTQTADAAAAEVTESERPSEVGNAPDGEVEASSQSGEAGRSKSRRGTTAEFGAE